MTLTVGRCVTTTQQRELRALQVSLVLTSLFTAGAIAVALRSDSETMSLEALSGLADVVVSVAAIFVARRVHEPANYRYHFGYAKYEPLMTAIEGILLAAIGAGAIVYSVRDLIHPDPLKDASFVIAYAFAGFLLSIVFGTWMKRVGRQTASPLVQAEAELWVVEGWLSLGICAAFVISELVGGPAASAYSDPAVCIVLALIFLWKPLRILGDSFADLVDANPYADTQNAVEESARACVERFHLKGLEWARVRKAGRRVFALVSFFGDPTAPLAGIERIREAVMVEIQRLNPDVEVYVLFRAE